MCLKLARYYKKYLQNREWNLSDSIWQDPTYNSAVTIYVFTSEYTFEVLKDAASWNFLGESLIQG